MKIEFLEAAEIELDEAFKWYEAQQQNLGLQFLTIILAPTKERAGH